MPPDTDIACDIVLAYHPPALRWVPTAIDSALNQQNARCIVHVIADAVDPSDQRHIRDLFRDAPNIRFYANESAIGPYRSLHKVFKHFETDHIAIQDSDDISLPHRIWYSVNALRQHDCEIFGGAMENFIDWRSADSDAIRRFMECEDVVWRSGKTWVDCPNGWIANPTMVVRKAAFQKLNGFADVYTGADVEFSERAHAAGVRRHFSDTVTVLRRVHESSLSQNGETGTRSEYFRNLSRHFMDIYEKYDGADPKKFGCLHEYLAPSHE